MQNLNRIGVIGLLALVALRVGVGWHFFKEGSDKIKSGTFSSEGFLKGANGRFAGFYHGMVWDYDGKIRLDQELMISEMDKAVVRAAERYGLTQEQIKELDTKKKKLVDALKGVYAEYDEQIVKLKKGEDRVAKMEDTPLWKEVASLRGQKESIEKERIYGIAPAVKGVDEIWKKLEDDINAVTSPEQYKASGAVHLKRPKEGLISSATVDRIIPLFDITVGVLLILGLFVPLAGWAGALFLFSVILSQFPGDPGSQPTYLYAVEALAMIVLASVGAGRYGGLDFFFWAWRRNKAATAAAA
jgi:uncharacterized membrane protein YphA (DoxX/SURF4 family)